MLNNTSNNNTVIKFLAEESSFIASKLLLYT
jgi:hypothetical protein